MNTRTLFIGTKRAHFDTFTFTDLWLIRFGLYDCVGVCKTWHIMSPKVTMTFNRFYISLIGANSLERGFVIFLLLYYWNILFWSSTLSSTIYYSPCTKGYSCVTNSFLFYFAVEELIDNDVESVSIAYKEACVKQNIEPIHSVLEQIQVS